MKNTATLFAVTAPGLASLTAAELNEIGITAVPEDGGVAWEGDAASLYRANLHLRTATRVLVRMGQFRARTFFELERHAQRLPWSRFLVEGRTVKLRVTCVKSKLYHEGAVAERFLEAIQHSTGSTGSVDRKEEAENSSQLFIIRFLRDVCTVSADSSGAPLYQRGYRQALAKAPLRETLAAAMVLASGWDRRAPLLDPLCGSGTIAIEAALLTRRIAPGLAAALRDPRDFAFRQWPEFHSGFWAQVVESARSQILPSADARIYASDHNAGAIRAARGNARRASVENDLRLDERDLAGLEVSEPVGWLVTNPPYGLRAGDSADVRDVRAQLERLATHQLDDWTIGVLQPENWPLLERSAEIFRTRNGGIPVRFCVRRTNS